MLPIVPLARLGLLFHVSVFSFQVCDDTSFRSTRRVDIAVLDRLPNSFSFALLIEPIFVRSNRMKLRREKPAVEAFLTMRSLLVPKFVLADEPSCAYTSAT